MASGWLMGKDPLPPDFGDKLTDWLTLVAGGGMGLVHGKRVLDVGPCYGLDAMMFAGYAKEYVALDLDDYAVDRLRRMVPRATVIYGDVCAPGILMAGLSFDTAIDFGSLDNVRDPFAGYRNIAGALRPGGTFVSTYANAAVLGAGKSPDDTELRQDPAGIRVFLESIGLVVTWTGFEDHPRAGLVAQKAAQ